MGILMPGWLSSFRLFSCESHKFILNNTYIFMYITEILLLLHHARPHNGVNICLVRIYNIIRSEWAIVGERLGVGLISVLAIWGNTLLISCRSFVYLLLTN